ncbi:MAG: SH3 domain-containing protein [Hyphomonas sp.]|uniref:SH3 domain-containing protein n=1 Tax=Hyphomonas sp. TaxID=87 RepID=UPI003529A3BB
MKWAPLLVSAAFFVGGAAIAQAPELVKISRFSGKPVPRFETLKYAMVNGRAGPSKDYPVLWEYQRQGLPVLVIKESDTWRRVRDPSGAEVWMHERMLESGHKAWVQTPTVLRMEPASSAVPVVDVGRGVLVDLGPCEAGWCEIRAKDYRGYAPQATLWGADTGTGQ